MARTLPKWMYLCLLILPLYCWGTPSSAQVSTGSLSGTVIDPQNALVADAQVRLVNTQTNEEHSTVSDATARSVSRSCNRETTVWKSQGPVSEKWYGNKTLLTSALIHASA